ncbi:RAB [Musa troglodytarum]|uniref:RAB n=1 Tax=Musa troglodytarum TaxID=320322 RepID=A0A9E7JIL9_9LILI|nr:RAB [Musa troglodytarum]
MGSSSGPGHGYDYAFKILLIGDSGVGKSSLLVSFISNHLADDLSPTIGALPSVLLLLLPLPLVVLFINTIAMTEADSALPDL